MIAGAERRIRQVCQDCIIMGRNPALTDANLFPDHTLRQLTEARKWTLDGPDSTRVNMFSQADYTELQEAQQKDVTFCPNRIDLFDLQRTPRTADWDPNSEAVVAWQTILRPSTYDPIVDRIRQHQSSRCMCVQAGFAIPLCDSCAQVGCINDYSYIAFCRQDLGTCECGAMLWDMYDENGTLVVAGHGWDPKKHSLSSPDTAVNSEGEGPAEATARESILGLCSWCGFQVYEQAEKGKLPQTETQWREYLVRRGIPHEEILSYEGSTSSESAEDTQMD